MSFLISSAAIDKYAAGPSASRRTQVANLHQAIRAELGTVYYETFLQGSYRNDTAIADINDVDIVALRKSVVSPQSAAGWEIDFNDIMRTLGRRWTVKKGDKCIRVSAGVDADVVPAGRVGDDWRIDPIVVYSRSGHTERPNYPRRHYRNGVTKQEETKDAYKPTVRLFKRWVRQYASLNAPSFFIECAIHSVPRNKLNTYLPLSFASVGAELLSYTQQLASPPWRATRTFSCRRSGPGPTSRTFRDTSARTSSTSCKQFNQRRRRKPTESGSLPSEIDNEQPFRILALDGGGIRGIFTAAVLAELESKFGPAFLRQVDLVVGTSTGGIIGLGLASGKTGREMLGFYREMGPEIFSRPRRLRRLRGPKYDRGPLDRILKEHFGEEAILNDLEKEVCITAHELISGSTRVIKDDHNPQLHWGGGRKVWEVAAATSAAPTYFDPVQLDTEDSHIDGGVWANNPAMVGIVEAIRYKDKSLEDIRLLSIGTTSHVLRVPSHAAALKLGTVGWIRKALGLLQGSTSAASHRQAELLLPTGNYLRLDEELNEKVPLDDVDAARPLQERGQNTARLNCRAVEALFDL